MKNFQLLLVLLIAFSNYLAAQEMIPIKNPSFEGPLSAGYLEYSVLKHWENCNFPGNTGVDIQPNQFYVSLAPEAGDSYVGMTVRSDETWEGIAQKLATPIKKGQKYVLTISLAKSSHYLSHTKGSKDLQNFVNPVHLQIWGGSALCDKGELLTKSPLITHEDWQSYTLAFEAKEDHHYIRLEAFYKTPILFSYNGNLLIDNCSNLEPVDAFKKEHITLDSKLPKSDYKIQSDTRYTGKMPERKSDSGSKTSKNIKLQSPKPIKQ